MRNEYTGLRKWDNWGAMFLVLCVFAIDTGLGNVYKVVGSEDYVTQVYQYVSFKEIFGLMPYCLLVIITQTVCRKSVKRSRIWQRKSMIV